MPRVSLELSEQLSDLRSRRVMYNVTVENPGQAPVFIRSMSPRVGPQVTVTQVETPADLAASGYVGGLCADLERLLRDWLASVVPEDPMPPGSGRRRLLRRLADRLQDNLVMLLLFVPQVTLRLWRELDAMASLPPRLAPTVERRIAGLVPRLDDYAAARHAVDTFRATFADPPPAVRAAIDVRLERLRRLDEGDHGPGLVPLMPDSQVSQTLELDFHRGWLNPRKHTVAIEVRYAEADEKTGRPSKDWRVATAAEFLMISPNPVMLTLTALAGAVLGTVLRFAVAGDPAVATPIDLAPPLHSLTSSAGVTAAILALVFFNVFEFTALAGRFRQYVNWRGALLIGVLCGLAGEKVLQALQGIVA